ncbi:MAG: rod shape-determining protein MreC [Crocinitomicaceae bacterium]|nr:rod shape-determining protein MreC [Crocinitomicaceae bacterium]MDG1657803.1 rod shape-determining protein MreC [Crocinitomicaceae bacterium]
MRNFLAFIQRFRVILFFAFLQGIVLSIYFTFSVFPRSQYLTTASNVSGSALTMQNDITKHFRLSDSNKKLQYENRWLRERLKENKLSESAVNGHDSITIKTDDEHFTQHFEYIPGTVINSTFTKRNNYFTLNIGNAQGVKRGMGVISDKGVVGVVHNSSEHFSVVKSCLTKDINIAVVIENSGEPGFLKWDGRNARKGNMAGVSNDRDIKLWSKIVTRGSAGIFPRGLPVGKVSKTEPIEGKPLWNVTVKYAENYRSVQYVYVINNLLQKEQHELELDVPPQPLDDE